MMSLAKIRDYLIMPRYALGTMILVSVLIGSSLAWQDIGAASMRAEYGFDMRLAFAGSILFALVVALIAFVAQIAFRLVGKAFPIKERYMSKRVRWWALTGPFFFLLWEAALLSHYPGMLFADSAGIIDQAALQAILTNQPPFLYKLILAIPLSVASALGNPSAGIAVFMSLQVAFMSGVVAYTFVWFRRKGLSVLVLVAAILLLGINPFVASYVITCFSTAPLAACILLLVLMLYDSMRNQASALRDASTLFKLVCLCGVLVLLKSFTIIIVVPVLLFLILYVKEHHVSLIVSSLVVLAVCFFVTGPVLVYFDPIIGKFGLDTSDIVGIIDHAPLFAVPPAFSEVNPAAYWDVRVANPVLPAAYMDGYVPVDLFEQWFGISFIFSGLLEAGRTAQSLPILGLLANGALLLWITAFGFTATLANRPPRYCIVYLPLLLLWLTAALASSHSNEMRVLFSLYICLPITLIVPFIKSMEESKSEVRLSLLALRKSILPISRIEAQSQVAARILALAKAQVAPGSYIGVYSAFGSELDLESLTTTLTKSGYKTALPVVHSDKLMTFVDFADEDSHSLLAVLLMAKPQTIASSKDLEQFKLVPPKDIGAIVVPGVGFDVNAMRIGYGCGYYDRYLRYLNYNTPVWGVAFDEQIVEQLPRGRFDLPVSAVITPTRYFVPVQY